MNYPQYKETDDVDKFIYGFQQLIKDMYLESINFCFGLLRLNFKDGSSIGTQTLMNKCGYIIEN